jgi:prevent-host-death family protein
VKQVNIHEAKTHLSKLIEDVEAGEDIIIARAGKPVARLTAFMLPKGIQLGLLKGKLTVREDFDAPLGVELMAKFAESAE